MEQPSIALSLSKEELAELTKMAYISQYVFDCCDDIYPCMETFNSLRRKINKLATEAIPESGLAEINELHAVKFTHTIKMEEEILPVLDAFGDECFNDRVVSTLANRDLKEKYGEGIENLFFIKELNNWFEDVLEMYEEEIENNGLNRLRLVTNIY